MKKQTNNRFYPKLRMAAWMVCWGVLLLPLAFEARAADALRAEAIGIGGTDLLAVLSDSGGGVVSMGLTLSPEPVLMAGLSDVAKVDGSGSGKLALKRDGTVWSLTQVGDQLVAAQIPGLDRVVDIAPAQSHFVALRDDGTVWTWGSGMYGQLGNGAKDFQATPVKVLNVEDAVAIGSGVLDTYVVRSDGTVWGCGGRSSAQAPLIAKIPGLDNVIAVSGGSHALFLKTNGTVMAWGQNKYGQIGDGTTSDRFEAPVPVTGLTDVIAVSAGKWHSLALKNDRTLWAWGENVHYECGVPARQPFPEQFLFAELVPVQVPISDVSAISADRSVSAALKTDRTVWIWGADVSRTYSNLQAPTQVFYGAGANHPPILVSAAWAEPSTVILPAGAKVYVVATDPDSDPLSYSWSQVSGAGTATFAAAGGAESGVSFSAGGSYVLRVTIGDGQGGSVSSEVTVTVQPGGSSGAGDLNGDKIVNIADLLLVIENWGKTPADAGYDARADADGNGLVNIQDVIIVAVNFGKTY